MKSRVAVSVLFILYAVTALRPEAIDALQKLKSLQHCWASKVPDRCAAEILNRITSRVSALKSEFHAPTHGDRPVLARHCAPENQRGRTGSLSPNGKTITSSFPDDAKVSSSPERLTERRLMNLINSGRHTTAFERVMTAVRQIHEVLDLMRTK